ncbi:MAG TPA: hexose kinase [Streptosporangiaceae bacterium]|nr:hexose kinase [Streptosporangiaceae bacterium]
MLIVNPNIATDRTIPLRILVPGSVHRTGTAETTLGGKGVNVARIGRALGHRAVVLTFFPADSAALLRQLAAAEQAELAGVPVPGSARAASILLEGSGRVTVLNEPGPQVGAAEWRQLLAEIGRRAAGHQTLVCSGSLPPGSPTDAYAQIVGIGRRAGLRTVVDAAGLALAAVLPAGPDVVSPNLAEAESLLSGPSVEGVEPAGAGVALRAADAARGLVARGARRAIVSAGRHGAAFSEAGRTMFCPAPSVTVASPVGAGDSLVGGLVHALEDGQDWPAAVPYAIAVASASCERPLAGTVDEARVAGLAAQARSLAAQAGGPAAQAGHDAPGVR